MDRKLAKIIDEPGLFKDLNSGAVIVSDYSAYEAFKKKRRKDLELESLQNEVGELKEEISELKKMIKELL